MIQEETKTTLFKILWIVLSFPLVSLMIFSSVLFRPAWYMKVYMVLLVGTLIVLQTSYMIYYYRPKVSERVQKFFAITLPLYCFMAVILSTLLLKFLK